MFTLIAMFCLRRKGHARTLEGNGHCSSQRPAWHESPIQNDKLFTLEKSQRPAWLKSPGMKREVDYVRKGRAYVNNGDLFEARAQDGNARRRRIQIAGDSIGGEPWYETRSWLR